MKNKIFNFDKQDLFPVSLILIMVVSRLIPHPPNFTPIIAIAMMSGFFFKNLNFSLIILIVSMLLGDIFLGFYSSMAFIYMPLCLIVLCMFKINNKINFKNLFFMGLGSSIFFYLTSNFGVWAIGTMYEKNVSGLINCYILAIPFFKNTLISTVIFSYTAYSANYYLKKKFSY
ncbi:hypothetical protein OAJ75_00070 [Candidatus Pelagibacter sp.]|nr:hypothetical protein [Candidatus Pelagibacter sp.]